MEKYFSLKLFAALLAFVVALAGGVHLLLRWYVPPSPAPESQPASPTLEVQPSQGSEVRIIGSDKTLPQNILSYTDDGFAPRTITVGSKPEIGCIIKLVNQSRWPVLLAIVPSRAGGDSAVPYPRVLAGESMFFDPRFHGFTEISFYNREKPADELTVKFDPFCRN